MGKLSERIRTREWRGREFTCFFVTNRSLIVILDFLVMRLFIIRIVGRRLYSRQVNYSFVGGI